MTDTIQFIVCLAGGYIVGSIPVGIIIARLVGKIDIRHHCSQNIGATNVGRVLGRKWGILVLLLDALKGVVAVVAGSLIGRQFGVDPMGTGIAALVGCIFGHSFSCFLRFKGGKGVATTIGGLLALLPEVMVVGIILWLLVFFATRYVSRQPARDLEPP